ncbi:hypothetical protein ACFUMH_04465 [Cellulomonas sp. NPDC057328]|uniref:hypothetical protein n=1 Tax=Cellulomonas sp. NPDC057328 TaxID=3346101 RepID=UPI0036404FE8
MVVAGTGRGARARGRGALPAAVVALLLAGCGAGAPGGPEAPGASGPPGTAGTSAPADAVETADPVVPEDPDAVEGAAPGDGGGIAIEVAGLPVGGNAPLDQDGTWCFPLFWSDAEADGVVVDIHTVRVEDPGATVRDEPCDGRPPCAGARLVGGAGSCSLLVTPPSPEVTGVRVALDATVRCTERAQCDAVRGAGWQWLDAPARAATATEPGDGTGTGTDTWDGGDGAEAPGTEAPGADDAGPDDAGPDDPGPGAHGTEG